jgi:hypothetical protein
MFLYIGLSIICIAFVVRWLGAPLYCFWGLLGLAISFKAVFLVAVFRAGPFRPGLWLYLILAGVVMILTSLLFKSIFPIPAIRNILFYGAISLKITGLILLLLDRKKSN